MKRIKFIQRTIFQQFGPNHPDNPVFEIDQIIELRNDQADRWLNRGKADLLEDLGSDDLVIEGADPAKVAEIRDEVERRFAADANDMAADLSEARKALSAVIQPAE